MALLEALFERTTSFRRFYAFFRRFHIWMTFFRRCLVMKCNSNRDVASMVEI